MRMRIRNAVRAAALVAASLTAFAGAAIAQQDSAQADTEAWVGQWLYRAMLGTSPVDMTGRINFQLTKGKLTGDMNEDRGARRWQIDGVRVDHNRLTGTATLQVGSMLPEGAPGLPEDYRVLEIQLKLEADRFTGSLRARTIRGSLEGRRP